MSKTIQNKKTLGFLCWFVSMLELTICGSVEWGDPGEAVGVDIERATGHVSQSDLKTQFKPMGDQ